MKPKTSPIPNLSDVIELTIDSLSYNGGRGVGRYQGVVVFVPLTAPEDQVRARVTLKKARFWEAELLEILQPSPMRRSPPCPVFERCGGCVWQHVQYGAQIEQKQKILDSSLRGLSKLGTFEVRPFLAAANEFHYRNRIQIQVRDGQCGFFARRSHSLVATNDCLISDPRINLKLKHLDLSTSGAHRLELALSLDGSVQISEAGRDPEAIQFAQVNEVQNQILKERVLAQIDFTPEWIMDLYAGSGNLTEPLATRFPDTKIEAVELSQSAVQRAQSDGHSSRVHWHAGDVGRILGKWKPRVGHGLVVLDPPRLGCERAVVDQLLRHSAKQIVYISCNPSTFARDAERLVQSGRYRLTSVQGLDMFPQTEHVELIASLCAAT